MDLYITVSNSIYEKLIVLLSDKIDSIKYLRFPVPDFTPLYKVDTIFNISFVGRKTIEKGYNILPLLAEKLASNNENICWHIFGSATNNQFDCFWNPEINVKHYGEVSQQFILSMLPKMDLLLLPSKAEGMPLSVIEGMKAGVVPIVANIDGGIQEIVIENITGYKIDNNHLDNYVEKILYLYKNEERLKSLKLNCIELANKNFNPLLNTLLIEDEILNLKSKNKLAVKVYGSRLDRKNLPNFITRFFRNFQQCKKLW